MQILKNNYAFIDTQNTWKGVSTLGWVLDWLKFRIYLQDKYNVTKAFLFIGYIEKHAPMYQSFEDAGFLIIFKPTIRDNYGNIKGNCDADMVLETVIHVQKYDKAVIVTSDGDFYSLVRYLYDCEKLEVVISPYGETCSHLLKNEAKDKLVCIYTLQSKISKDTNEKAPHGDETP